MTDWWEKYPIAEAPTATIDPAGSDEVAAKPLSQWWEKYPIAESRAPVSPEEAKDRAGQVWDMGFENQIPLSMADEFHYDLHRAENTPADPVSLSRLGTDIYPKFEYMEDPAGLIRNLDPEKLAQINEQQEQQVGIVKDFMEVPYQAPFIADPDDFATAPEPEPTAKEKLASVSNSDLDFISDTVNSNIMRFSEEERAAIERERMVRKIVDGLERAPEGKAILAMSTINFSNLFGFNEWLSRMGVSPIETTPYWQEDAPEGLYSAAVEASARFMAAKNQVDPVNMARAANIGTSVLRTALEFYLTPGASLAKAPASVRPFLQTGIKFATHEAMQAPREGETLTGRAGSVLESGAIGAGVGAAGKFIPNAAVRVPAVVGGFTGLTYARTGDLEQAVETGVTVLGFEALGLMQKAGRLSSQKLRNVFADKAVQAARKHNPDLYGLSNKEVGRILEQSARNWADHTDRDLSHAKAREEAQRAWKMKQQGDDSAWVSMQKTGRSGLVQDPFAGIYKGGMLPEPVTKRQYTLIPKQWFNVRNLVDIGAPALRLPKSSAPLPSGDGERTRKSFIWADEFGKIPVRLAYPEILSTARAFTDEIVFVKNTRGENYYLAPKPVIAEIKKRFGDDWAQQLPKPERTPKQQLYDALNSMERELKTNPRISPDMVGESLVFLAGEYKIPLDQLTPRALKYVQEYENARENQSLLDNVSERVEQTLQLTEAERELAAERAAIQAETEADYTGGFLDDILATEYGQEPADLLGRPILSGGTTGAQREMFALENFKTVKEQERINALNDVEGQQTFFGADWGKTNTVTSRAEYDSIISRQKAQAETLRQQRGKGKRKGFAYQPGSQDFKDAVKVGMFHIEAGLRNFAAWSKKMIEEFGDKIKPSLEKIWNDATTSYAAQSKERGFTASVRKFNPELKVEGQYIPRSTDVLSMKARNMIIDDIQQARKIALTGNNEQAVAIASELIKYYGEQAAKATDPAIKEAIDNEAAVVANEIAHKLTELGRAVQAASILSRLTPEGQIRFAAREVQKYNEQVEQKRGGLFGLKKKIPDITAKQVDYIRSEMQAIQGMPEGSEKAIRFMKLQNYITDLVPSPFMAKAVSVWKAGLLTGVKTTGLNVFANASHGATEAVKDIPASMVDKIASYFTGQRTVTPNLKGTFAGAVEGTQKGLRYLRTGYDERNVGTKLDYRRLNFGKGYAGKALQAYVDTVFHVLGAEDQPFYYAAKLRSLYEQAKVEAINMNLKGEAAQKFIDSMIENPTERMLINATKDAETAVFQNTTALGEAGKTIQKLPLAEFVVPFAKTPSAVAMQIVNYTPVGIAKTIIENIGKGRFDQRDFSQGMGRGLTGTAILFVGASLFKAGMIALDYPETDKERELWRLEGRKPNSVLIDGKWRSVQILGPAGNLLLIGGQFQRAFNESGSPTEAMELALGGSAKSFTEQTFLQGVNMFMDAITDPQRSGGRFVGNLLASGVPTLVSDIARATDPYERRADTTTERILARIPGARQSLEFDINALGRERESAGNMFEIMADPTRPSEASSDPVAVELRRLWNEGYRVSPTLLGGRKGYKILTPEENTEIRKRSGQIVYDSITAILSDVNYPAYPDDVKADAIEMIVTEAREAAKNETLARKLNGLKNEDLLKMFAELKKEGLLSRSISSKLSKKDAELLEQYAE